MTCTPGPWAVKEDRLGRPNQIVGADSSPVTGWGSISRPTTEEGRANAALIATAPDHNAVALELDRLQLVIESAVRNADPGNRPAVMALLRANTAAIAKATGKD